VECPNQHGRMIVKRMVKKVPFRGKLLNLRLQHFVCPQCGVEADDLNFAAANQKVLSDAYRRAAGLLTGEQIVVGRRKLNWTQEDLARAANVGIASIKRWETGQIQTSAMDDVLRNALSGKKTATESPKMKGRRRRTKEENSEHTSDSEIIAMMPWRKQRITDIQNPRDCDLSWGRV
jgi:putative zinc finger/helix-turn-helix YgiT family protein